MINDHMIMSINQIWNPFPCMLVYGTGWSERIQMFHDCSSKCQITSYHCKKSNRSGCIKPHLSFPVFQHVYPRILTPLNIMQKVIGRNGFCKLSLIWAWSETSDEDHVEAFNKLGLLFTKFVSFSLNKILVVGRWYKIQQWHGVHLLTSARNCLARFCSEIREDKCHLLKFYFHPDKSSTIPPWEMLTQLMTNWWACKKE